MTCLNPDRTFLLPHIRFDNFLWEAIGRVRENEGPALTQPLSSGGPEKLAAQLVRLAPGPMRYMTCVAAQRGDVFVCEGGLMDLPEPARLGRNNVRGFPRGVNLACLSETIALAMAGVRRSYTLGDRIPRAEAEEVYALARDHGFRIRVVASEKHEESADARGAVSASLD